MPSNNAVSSMSMLTLCLRPISGSSNNGSILKPAATNEEGCLSSILNPPQSSKNLAVYILILLLSNDSGTLNNELLGIFRQLIPERICSALLGSVLIDCTLTINGVKKTAEMLAIYSAFLQ